MPQPAPSQRFPESRRLHGRLIFSAVYNARVRESRHPLTIYAKPNNLPHLRLGISISRAVGTAVARNRIKRLIRESFRLGQHELPAGLDLIVVVRPHRPLALADYQTILSALVPRLHSAWQLR